MSTVLPLYYFPSIDWYALAFRAQTWYLDVGQAYERQHYFSRTFIRTAQGAQLLSVPVSRRNPRALLGEKEVSYRETWQRQHLRSIVYAYRNAPYFLYYEDELRALFDAKFTKLAALNLATIEALNHWMRLDVTLVPTAVKNDSAIPSKKDYRAVFDAKNRKPAPGISPGLYPQVFEGFEPNLSTLDLVFNLGPESRQFLQEAYRSR